VKHVKTKSPKLSHTPRSAKGLGDYYGTGIRAKIGKMRHDSMGIETMTPKKLKTPPKTLA
jgi:hypothetical protein